MVAGASSTLCTNPIWVIKTRLMSQAKLNTSAASKAPWHYKSTLDAARKMYATEGILSFYSGLTPALLGLTHVAVQFPLYEAFKRMFTGGGMGQPLEEGKASPYGGILAASCLSKVCASSATYPHEVIRTRLQTQQRSIPQVSPEGIAFRGSLDNPPRASHPPGSVQRESAMESTHHRRGLPRYRGVVSTFKTILREEGWRAFYAGMGTNMIRAVPASAMTMLTYEFMVTNIKRQKIVAQHKLGIEPEEPL
jgi:solute carrier family 25 (mitochondrial folate transporter), member 32